MQPRENILRAVKRQNPDHVPYEFGLTPTMVGKFRKWAGIGENEPADLLKFFDFEARGVGPDAAPGERPDYTKYYADPEIAKHADGHGVARVPGTYYHFTHTISPLAKVMDPKVAEDYPIVERRHPVCWAKFKERVDNIHKAGYAANYFCGHIFETGWQIRGMEQMLEEFVTGGDVSRILLQRIADDNAYAAEQAVKGGLDILSCGDDVGTQHGMMMSPKAWREWLKPLLAKEIAAGRKVNPDIPVWYHSDGNIEEIIPDLIEVGVTILNPVQPECMNPAALKKKYGDELSFWGCVGTQSVMPWGKPKDVREAVKKTIQTVGEGGGLVIAPTHVLEPEVPWENVLAMVEAVKEFGKY